ncbi:MAG: hypothetical protein JRJ84_16635 [Deltaproteobacteria bacterium]|nr:hypothetical protein [Deltaproteobacteria bacterium]
MRPFIVSLVVLIAAGGCTEPTNSSAFEPEYTLRVFGDFERLNPADRDSVWVGVEHTRIVDNQGTLVCEDVLNTEAWEIEDSDADLSLEMAREGIADLVPDCTRVYADEMSRITGQRYLSFVASHSRYGEAFCTVHTSDDFEEWERYASGMLIDGALAYHRTQRIFAASVREPPMGDPGDGIRDLGEPPLKQ